MPYVVTAELREDRIVAVEGTLEFCRAFYFPIGRGEPLTPELLALRPDPLYVRMKGTNRRSLPAIFDGSVSVWIVRNDVRQIIENLEPGVHTFVPLNLKVRGSARDCGQFYLLWIGQAIDAVVIDETDFRDGRGRVGFEGRISFIPGPAAVLSPFGDTVLDGSLIEGRHLWRGARGKLGQSVPFSRVYFCSDALATRIEAAKLRGWWFRQCKVR
jgi:hypothetical protein